MEFLIKSEKKGQFIIYLDEEDYSRVLSYNWNVRLTDGVYYIRGRTKDKNRKGVNMPNIILGHPGGKIVYKDGNRFNNCKNNLIYIPSNNYIEKIGYYEIEICSLKHGLKKASIDKADFDLVNKYEWHLSKQGNRYYAYSNTIINGKNKMISMHRLIMGFPNGYEVDHKDNNGINNKRDNLRLATHEQNNMNKGCQVNNKTGYKGVHFFKRDQTFQAYIVSSKKRKHLGYFKTAIEAAKKYNEEAIKIHGEFAYLNSIPNE